MTRYPIYLPSIHRSGWSGTAAPRLLRDAGLPFLLVVHPFEAEHYVAAFGPEHVLVVPWDPAGGKDGLVRVRNFILDHARASGAARHWQLDDDVRGFFRRRGTTTERCDADEALSASEGLADSFGNVLMSGPAYKTWVFGKEFPRRRANRCVASALLIRNDAPYRFRGLQEDLDLTLQILADGYCTLLQYDYLIDVPSSRLTVGGLADRYADDAKRAFAESTLALWPEIARMKRHPTGRWYSKVDYSGFRSVPRPVGEAFEAVPVPRQETLWQGSLG